ncbi:SCO2322 family protein [Streptomyces sp. NPDC057496]|uniref:SCO2322 family protein n=1 Tax=Streptomyces sp. NPDC057496 TaxID=3346149 RepID=UPI0036A7BB00
MRRAGRAGAPPATPGVVLAVLTVLAVLLGTGTAHAAGYRYWSFWEGSGTGWTYATQGPSLVRPDDGTVQGFRFAVSEDSQDAAKPRHAPDFAKICAGTPARDGTKRIALVIDAGTAADAPSGQTPPAPRTACARVAPDASSAEALASVAKPLRYDSAAMLCAISGYPRAGCGEQVPDGGGGTSSAAGTTPPAGSGTTSDAVDDSGGGPSAGVFVGAGAVLLLGVAAIAQARRRRG